MAMTHREKQLIFVVLGLVLVLTHMWGIQRFMQSYRRTFRAVARLSAAVAIFSTR